MKICHAKRYRGFWIVGLYLNGGDLIAGKDRRAGRWLQSTARRSAMGDGGQLAGDHGSDGSGHLAFIRLHRDILRDLADSTRYKWKTESMSRRRPVAVP